MSETIVAALITGAITLMGVLVSNSKTQAVTETKLEELTREVREHNNFAKRMPVVEAEVQSLKETVDKLERYHSEPYN